MGGITLHTDRDTSATYVPNRFIDNYMTSANGEYVKIYLYLLRCMNSPDQDFSLSGAADKFDHTEKDVQRALKYWEKMHLLELEYDKDKKLSGIRFLDKADGSAEGGQAAGAGAGASAGAGAGASADAGADVFAGAGAGASAGAGADVFAGAGSGKGTPARVSYTAAELAAFQEKNDVSELLFVTEHYLKRPLTPTDINTILFWYDRLAFSADLIEYLIEYCIGKGHTSIRYMDKVALGWQAEGIATVEQAKRASASFSQLHFSVMRALGISGRNLIPAETAYIDKWHKELGFSADIITEACRRTIAAVHQPSFEYTDRILTRWHRQEVRKLSDIAGLDAQHQKTRTTAAAQNRTVSGSRFNNFSQRTYDYDKLEQQLLNQR